MWVPVASATTRSGSWELVASFSEFMAAWGQRARRGHGPVDLADDVALEAAEDLAAREALGGTPSDVGLGGRVGGHAHHRDAPQRMVGGPVPAAVEAMPLGLA